MFVGKNALVDAKPTNDVIANETNHDSFTSSFERYCLDPLCVTLSGSKDLYITLTWWINRTNEIEGPSVK